MSNRSLEFEEFYRQAKDECLVTVLVSVGERDLAQELVAEAFARAWVSWTKVSEHPAPKAWVVRTALNAHVSSWRRRRREVLVPDPTLVADTQTTDHADHTFDPSLIEALLSLPVRQRQVVALRVFIDLDIARTAEVLGIAPGTVQAHLGRAIATLRNDLVPQPQQEHPQ